ncbi:ATP-binding protein [Proteus genomosp. 6]|uniref:ATP-binding protein n=1 Tax=Proteus genomosp. 6 TaxID=1311820 RepID=A0ABV1LAQ4_9GAMM
MQPIDIKAHPDHLEKISKETPVKALAELIWNGFDAKAKSVHVKINNNDLDSIDSIEVIDTGDGIIFEKLDDLFGDLGGSWKKNAKKSGEDYLHGENGQGRFKSFSLGGLVEWNTNYIDGDDSYNYKIKSDVNELLRAHKTEKTKNKVKKKGTTVTISNVTKEASILNTDIKVKLAEIFCMYLSKYKDKKLFFKGEEITPDLVQKSVKKINMGDVYVSEDLTIELVINIVEWKESIKSCK